MIRPQMNELSLKSFKVLINSPVPIVLIIVFDKFGVVISYNGFKFKNPCNILNIKK